MSALDNENGSFFILANEKLEKSLWPEFKNVPDGWHVAFGPGTRDECLAWVEEGAPVAQNADR
ncbi:MbtH family protein [Citricoccus sp. NR2]|uniref:MbtH family protein n=1 Tax=Citricoccus sp. NR2 TaxID=3004095 RepID=UPI0022DE90F8|nr:MbtH family protein [Citricoccus sp. NR2]WBL19052.1 MbtH family protein [Citricoccus sp. NR2]